MQNKTKLLKLLEYPIKFIKYSQNICYTAGIILMIFTLKKKNHFGSINGDPHQANRRMDQKQSHILSFSKAASPSVLWEHLLCRLYCGAT